MKLSMEEGYSCEGEVIKGSQIDCIEITGAKMNMSELRIMFNNDTYLSIVPEISWHSRGCRVYMIRNEGQVLKEPPADRKPNDQTS